MKKQIVFIAAMLIGLTTYAQIGVFRNLQVKSRFSLADFYVTAISNDTSATRSARKLMTEKAIKDYVDARPVGGSGGSMIYPSKGIALSSGSAWETSLLGIDGQFLRSNGTVDPPTFSDIQIPDITGLMDALNSKSSNGMGAANRLGYYTAASTSLSPLAAITAYRALISDANGLPVASGVTNTELGFLSGVTNSIQIQLNSKLSAVPAQSFASLTGKPTTLSGYGITDAYPLTGNPSGFLTSYTETDPTAVKLTGNQTVAGIKTFSNGIYSSSWTKLSVGSGSQSQMSAASLNGVGLSVGGSSGVTYGLNVGVNIANGQTFLQAGNWTSNAWYNMNLQASGGNLAVGKIDPTEKLDVGGNIRLSGALMPNNIAGTAGQVLMSAGTDVPPTWQTSTPGVSLAQMNDSIDANTTQIIPISPLFKDGDSLKVKPASSSDIGVVTPAKFDEWNAKQTALVSGANIKTVNGSSVLGSGNITISGGTPVVGKWPVEKSTGGGTDTIKVNSSSAALSYSGTDVNWNYATNVNKTLAVANTVTNLAITNDFDGAVGVLLVTNSSGGPTEFNPPSDLGNNFDLPNTFPNSIYDGEKYLFTYIRIGSIRYWNSSKRN